MLLRKKKKRKEILPKINCLLPPPFKKIEQGIHVTAMLRGFTDISTSAFIIGDIGASKVNLEIINK